MCQPNFVNRRNFTRPQVASVYEPIDSGITNRGITMTIVYKTEIEDGIAEKVRTSRVILASKVQVVSPYEIPEAAKAKLRGFAKASVGDVDLHYLRSILVTTGWNQNNDVFDPLEVWMAKATPVFKPVNYEHVGADIVGTTIAAKLVDADGNGIAEDVTIDSLPPKFHLLTEDVLYKVWSEPKLQERMDRVLAEIARGEWYVSMECLFRQFDYALRARDGTEKAVARTAETAFLTKHLRAYGGTGKYGEFTVGRVFKDITFSGKGLVRHPANPDSIIINDTPTAQGDVLASAVAAFFDDEMSPAQAKLVFASKLERDIYEFFQR